MIKEFIYTSSKGTNQRRVLVVKENDHYIGGFDLNLLSKDDGDTMVKLYKDVVPVSDFKSKLSLENFNQEWAKSYRLFVKNKIKTF